MNTQAGELIRTYVWGLDLSGTMQGAGGIGGLLWVNVESGSHAGRYFAAYDGNGNVMALISASDGAVVAQYEYGPFAEPLRATGPLAADNPFRFSTKYTDPETGLVYYGYRYYSPSLGRWLRRDPVEEGGGVNLYCILHNAPISRWDPTGLEDPYLLFPGDPIHPSREKLERYFKYYLPEIHKLNEVEYMFEIIQGEFTQGFTGQWSQPASAGQGCFSHTSDDRVVCTYVEIVSVPSPSGSCNTVCTPYGVGHGGTIQLYVRSKCAGKYRITIKWIVAVSGRGPKGGAEAVLESGTQKTIDGIKVMRNNTVPRSGRYSVDVTITQTDHWYLVIQHVPIIGIIGGGPKGQSAGHVLGCIKLLSIERLR